MKSKGVEIFAVATTDQINFGPLQNSVSLPVDQHILKVKEMINLFGLINERTLDKCDSNAFSFFQNYQYDFCWSLQLINVFLKKQNVNYI